MNLWEFIHKRWPSERQCVTVLLAVLIGSLLKMADNDPKLWDVELFKILLQGAIMTGALNMVLAFHFAANKGDEEKTQNTRAAFEAITATATANATPVTDAVTTASQAVATAGQNKADEIAEGELPHPTFGDDK